MQLNIDNAVVDFGLLERDQPSVVRLTFTNPSPTMSVTWQFGVNDASLRNLLTFYPPCGLLSPLEAGTSVVTFRSDAEGLYRFIIHALVGGGSPIFIGSTAHVSRPAVSVTPVALDFGFIAAGLPATQSLTFSNAALLPAAILPRSLPTFLTVSPSNHVIRAGESCIFVCSYLTDTLGAFADVARFRVDGLSEDEDIFVPLQGVASGLQIVVCDTENGDVAMTAIALSGAVHALHSRTVFVRNNTGITATMQASLSNYESISKESISKESNSKTGTVSLYKSVAKSLLQTKPSQLSNVKGCTLTVTPSSFELKPFAIVAVTLTGCADLFGTYNDRLLLANTKSNDGTMSIAVEFKATGKN